MHAKSARLHNRYDKLANDERLRLIAGAIGRKDDEELEVLISTTPRKTYSMPDASVVDRLAAIWRISMLYWLATEELQREIDTKRLTVLLVRSEYETRQLANIDYDKRKCLAIIDSLAHQLIGFECMLWSLSQAIHRFAKKIGFQPAELLAYAPSSVQERHLVLLPNQEVQIKGDRLEEMIETYIRLFSTQWAEFEASDLVKSG